MPISIQRTKGVHIWINWRWKCLNVLQVILTLTLCNFFQYPIFRTNEPLNVWYFFYIRVVHLRESVRAIVQVGYKLKLREPAYITFLVYSCISNQSFTFTYILLNVSFYPVLLPFKSLWTQSKIMFAHVMFIVQ